MVDINAKTKLVGVVGWPAEHSLSPAMQNAAIEKLGLNWVYLAFPVPPQHLAEAIAGAKALGYVGLNITIPHKEAVRGTLDGVDPLAKAIGAVNTIHFHEGLAIGFNTDAEGYTRTIEEESAFRFKGRTVLQIGAGGAGRAMAAGAAAAGAARVILSDIDADRAVHLATHMKNHYPAVAFEALMAPALLPEAARQADLIANATPLGMKPGDPLPLPAEVIEPRHTLFDAVYVTAHTPLLEEAKKKGAQVVSGLGMLARQGARSLEIWCAQRPDEALMIQVLKEKLGVS